MQATITLESLNDVEHQLGVLGQKLAERKQIESTFAGKIQGLKSDLDTATNDLDGEIETIETAIETYVKDNIDLFRAGKKKSKEFKTGSILTRETDTFDYPDDDELVRRLRLHGYDAFIKSEEAAMKDLIKKAAEQDHTLLDLLGIIKGKEVAVKIKTI